MTEKQALTAEDLQDIRERAEATCTLKTLDADKAFDFFYYDVPKLLAEVERLRKAIRYMRCEECGNQFGDNYFVGGTLCSECVGESDD